ncbi:MAG: S-methyl-5-thioribose-1-phosphate isomerase [bacterium]
MPKHIEGNFHTLEYGEGVLRLIDQTRLPGEEVYLECRTEEEVAEAIRAMVVRGAPAIGVAAAYGMAMAAARRADLSPEEIRAALDAAGERLAATRPTAVNLFWAIERMREAARASGAAGGEALAGELLALAAEMHREDVAICRRIGDLGAGLLPEEGQVLTHCNAGALATAGYGTAGGVIRSGFRDGKVKRVWVDETRPFLQGARLTAWELSRDGIPVTLIADNMAAFCMQQGRVGVVVVGADRVAANGDVANKIGTYGLAVLAREHGVPFYVAAPMSTIDFKTPTGEDIPIEERSAEELRTIGGRRIAPEEVEVFHPAFDVTPARLVDALVTERGVVRLAAGESLETLSGP